MERTRSVTEKLDRLMSGMGGDGPEVGGNGVGEEEGGLEDAEEVQVNAENDKSCYNFD